jgi:glycosyltransferase involved in cell wall biosynthesis
MLFIRYGTFKNAYDSPRYSTPLIKILLKIPSYVGSQGLGWNKLYHSLGVSDEKIILVRNWIPFGYSIRKTNKRVAEEELLTFVYVGWLIKEKGVYELIDAIEVLASTFSFKFIFIGGGTLQEELHTRIEKSDLSDKVISKGWQEQKEVKQVLNSSHVFVLPSYAEGFPNALLEAMSMGLPAICTDVGGVSDSLKNDVNGYLIKPKNTNMIIESMKKYLLNKGLVEKHSKATIEIAATKHNWENNCKQLFSVFDKK